MLRGDDITLAVERGVITQAQADALDQIAADRHKARVFALGREERFRLLGGFNDFFIAIGVVMLGIASMSVPWLGLILFWGLAEYLTGRLRLVAPSIVIVVVLVLLSAYACRSLITGIGLREGYLLLGTALAPVIVASAHYLRFRLPFSLLALAAAGVFFCLTAYGLAVTNAGVTKDAAAQSSVWVALFLGVAIFMWAMSFDVTDPERTTRRADCGFWLHLLAAPLIMHPLAGPLINSPLLGRVKAPAGDVTSLDLVLVVLLISALSVVALIVDRRALLVAGLSYFGAALAFTLSKVTGSSASSFTLVTLIILGVLIITLGVGWRTIRAFLMSCFPSGSWQRSLPPYETTP